MRFSERKDLADELWPKWVAAHPLMTQAWLNENAQSRSAFVAGAMMAATEMSKKTEDSDHA